MKNPFLILTPENFVKDLSSIHPRVFNVFLQKHGAIIFKNYKFNIEQFDRFSSSFSGKDIIHGGVRAKVDKDDRIQDVTIGKEKIPGHIEMGRRPDQPDIAWFFCQNPALNGGELILIDGLEVSKVLDEETKDYFTKNEIRFKGKVSKTSWQRSFGIDSFEGLKSHLAKNFSRPNVNFQFHEEDESFTGQFQTSAFKGLAFANSILGPYKGEAGGQCFDENDRPLSASILRKVQSAYDLCAVNFKLEAGDFALIDNQRVMHGREEFETPQYHPRQIFAKFTKQKELEL